MLHHVAGWLRTQGKPRVVRRRWARFIGRNWARVSYGYRVEPTWLELNRVDVPVKGLPESFAGFRIVQLTDFHCSRKLSTAYLDETIDLAQAQQPDLVVLTGDYIHHGYRHVDRLADAVSLLSAPCGVFAVLGNHDFSVRNALGLRRHARLHQTIAEALTRRGIRVLRNETVPIQRGED